MTPESQQKILHTASRLFDQLSNALGHKSDCAYEEGIRFVRENCGKTMFELLFSLAKTMLPGKIGEITPENFPSFLGQMDTLEKLKVILRKLPEPEPHRLDDTLKAINAGLPALRQILMPFAKQLPHPRGGAPKKFPDPTKRQAIRGEIGALLANGVALADAQKRIATREHVSLSTIQRIWRERKNQGNTAGLSL